MTDGAILAGALLVVAAVARWTGVSTANALLDKAAAAGVATAVIQHGWREVYQEGIVHPELLSLGYLITAYARGTTLRGAALTWAASFGRHLLLDETQNVEVRPIASGDRSGNVQSYQVTLVSRTPQRTPLLGLAQTLLHSLGIASRTGGAECPTR